jgi:hypothetical protein
MIMEGQFENTPKKSPVNCFNIFINFSEDFKGNKKKLIRVAGLLFHILKWHPLMQSAQTFSGADPVS